MGSALPCPLRLLSVGWAAARARSFGSPRGETGCSLLLANNAAVSGRCSRGCLVDYRGELAKPLNVRPGSLRGKDAGFTT